MRYSGAAIMMMIQPPLPHRFHGGEGDHVADALTVGHQHAEAVEADAKPAHRRHAKRQSLDEILVDRMRRPVGPAFLLGLFEKARALLARVVQLAERIGDFPAVHVSLEPLRDLRPVGPGLGERRDFLRQIEHMQGLHQLVLDLRGEHGFYHLTPAEAGFGGNADFCRRHACRMRVRMLVKIEVGERRRIAERYASGETMAALAREYRCGEATVWRALRAS
jgi:hypothetical protein